MDDQDDIVTEHPDHDRESDGNAATLANSESYDDDEVVTELRRRETEDEEIQRHLHPEDESMEEPNLSAVLHNDNFVGDQPIEEVGFVSEHPNGDGGNDFDEEDDEEEDEEDDIQITLGDFSKTSLTGVGTTGGFGSNINLNLNKGGRQFGIGASTTSGIGKTKSSLDLDAVGTFQDVPIFDLNLDTLQEKPWRKPGADITDYFNYGFNEDSWKIYCERQKKIRALNSANAFDINSGINLASMPVKTLMEGNLMMATPLIDKPNPSTPVNENSKYNGACSIVINTAKKAGPPPGRKTSGAIDVIGGGAPPMVVTSMLHRDTSTPPRNEVPGLTPNPVNLKENYISVIGNRSGPPIPTLSFPPPIPLPPPFGFPPPDFPPGLRPPLSILPPPLASNRQPLQFVGPDSFANPLGHRFGPPHGGILPHPESLGRPPPFDDEFGSHDSISRRSRISPNSRGHHSREHESPFSSSGSRRVYRDYDEGGSSRNSAPRRDHYRERDYRETERSRDRSRERSQDRRSREMDSSTLISSMSGSSSSNLIAPSTSSTNVSSSGRRQRDRNDHKEKEEERKNPKDSRSNKDKNDQHHKDKEKDRDKEKVKDKDRERNKEKSKNSSFDSDKHHYRGSESKSDTKDSSRSSKLKHDLEQDRKHSSVSSSSRHHDVSSSSKSSSSKSSKSKSSHRSKDDK